MLRNISLRDIGTALLDPVLPRRCVVCGRDLLLKEKYICTKCLTGLPETFFWTLPHNPMADRFNAMIQKDLPEGTTEPYSYAVSLFFYRGESPYRLITPHLKYNHGLASGRFFSRLLAQRIATAEHFADIDWVVPVPLHWTRRLRRGHNQSETIAREIADVLGAQLHPRVIIRNRHTRSQTHLSVDSKLSNVAGAFSLRPGYAPNACPHHILLVDDVFTTGSTMNACRNALRERFGPEVRISAASLAFVDD